jgi:methionine-rich copper-binding protein CopC
MISRALLPLTLMVVLAAADVTQDADDQRSFGVALEHALSSGTYTVAWRAIGADGHVVRADYQFTVVAK